MKLIDLVALDTVSNIIPLLRAHDPEICGGKATSLGRALRAGLPVPDGVVLSRTLVERIALGDGTADCDHLARWLGANMPAGTRLAVRSSAVDEDGASVSFAGQYVTRLGVRLTSDALRVAVIAVHGSLDGPSATAYRAWAGTVGPRSMAVLIQPLIEADVAGVLFTRNPITGADERVVEATIGLGALSPASSTPTCIDLPPTARCWNRAQASNESP